jgi:hypothetical protein
MEVKWRTDPEPTMVPVAEIEPTIVRMLADQKAKESASPDYS